MKLNCFQCIARYNGSCKETRKEKKNCKRALKSTNGRLESSFFTVIHSKMKIDKEGNILSFEFIDKDIKK